MAVCRCLALEIFATHSTSTTAFRRRDARIEVEAAIEFGARAKALVGELPPTVARDFPTLRRLVEYVEHREGPEGQGDPLTLWQFLRPLWAGAPFLQALRGVLGGREAGPERGHGPENQISRTAATRNHIPVVQRL